jgi:hypothetical protein
MPVGQETLRFIRQDLISPIYRACMIREQRLGWRDARQ